MDQKPEIKPVFNKLSSWQWGKLKAPALMQDLSIFAKEEIRESPWKYPFYAAYIGCWAMGWGGLWLISAAVTAPLAPYVMFMPTPWAKKARQSLSDAFSDAALHRLYERHPGCFVADSNAAGGYKIKGLRLFWNAAKDSWRDMRESYGVFRDYYFPPKPPAA